MWATSKLLGNTPNSWIKRLLHPQGQNAESAYLQRAESAINQRFHKTLALPMLPVGFTLAGLLAYFSGIGIATGTWNYELLLGFALAVVCCYPFLMHLQLLDFRKKVSGFAAKQMARSARPEAAGKILIAAAGHSDAIVRLAAVAGLRELGTNSGIEALKKLADDKQSEVALQAKDAMRDLLPVLRGESVLSVRTMDTYVEEHRFLQKSLKSSNSDKVKRAFEKLHEISLQIDEIVYSQLAIRRAFPDVYCTACYARAESQHYEEWEWVRCKQCKEVHDLRLGVEKVYGQIGGDPLPNEGSLVNGILHVGLWDEKTQKGRYGEIEVLEIIGGNAINYDWAISAVIEKFHNQHQGPANMLTVRFVANPILEANTIHLLRTLDPGLIKS